MTDVPLSRLVGHRGLAAHAPENTLAGIECAALHGLPWVEFDVRLTKDSQAVLMHDDTLERTTTGAGPVRARTLAEIEKLDIAPSMRNDHKVPTLEQALDTVHAHDLRVVIEVKSVRADAAATAEVVARTLSDGWLARLPSVIVTSFCEPVLEGIAGRLPGCSIALNVRTVPKDWRSRLSSLGAVALHVGYKRLSRRQVTAVRQAGYAVRAFTVNDVRAARRLLDRGVDGIFTDTAFVPLKP